MLGTALLIALCLLASGRAFAPAAGLLFAGYLPLALVEALVTGAALSFLARVEPGLLPGASNAR